MNTQLITVFEIIYLYYMFCVFKTTHSIHHPFESIITGKLSNYFKHPMSTGVYESKICPFGKQAIIILLLFLSYRIFFSVPPIVNVYLLIITFIVSLLNLNALLYLLPYFIIELWMIFT